MHESLRPVRKLEHTNANPLSDGTLAKPEVHSYVGIGPGFVESLQRFAKREVPHHHLNGELTHDFQHDRDLREQLMRDLLRTPEEVVIASAHQNFRYVYILKSKEALPFGRAGVIFTQIENEAPVPAGYWMDRWEPALKIPKRAYTTLPVEQRAAHEAELQLQYVLEQYWGRHFMFWYPAAYEKWISTQGDLLNPIECQPTLARRLVTEAGTNLD